MVINNNIYINNIVNNGVFVINKTSHYYCRQVDYYIRL